jgi:hypothetical protein
MAQEKDNKWVIEFSRFYQGLSPAHFENTKSEFGNAGHANAMTDCNVLDPTFVTQGPGLAALTAGTQAGAITELTTFILDKAVAADATYGIGATKLQKISATAVTNAGIWPHAITNCTDGESIVHAKGVLYYFFNKAAAGEVGKYDLATTFDDDWGSTVPTGKAALQLAPHPSAYKEDLIVFGNGRYVGVYTISTNTIAPTKLDFGTDAVVADVWFHQNYWWIAVNNPDLTGSNKSVGQIYIWDGAALDSLLEDETAVGPQRIGFGYVVNGITYIAYQDLSSSGGYKIGYLSGSQIKPLGNFTGALPNFAQKTLYKDTVIFVSSDKIWSLGAINDNLPVQMSQIADGGYATVGALAAPFGTPMVGSTDGATNFQLAKFSGYALTSTWTSLITDVAHDGNVSEADELIVFTKTLLTGASAAITVKYNQEVSNSGAKTVSTIANRRHAFALGSGAIEDLRVYISWAGGSATNDCGIRKIIIKGHTIQR